MRQRSIGIAMSGGVDSTAAALLLKNDHRVQGFFMNLGQPDFKQQQERVQQIGIALGIPVSIVDLRKHFKHRVLDYFSDAYFSGKTPNPCMICNHAIKFGLFMDSILESGSSQMATGHYARVRATETGTELLCGTDTYKDQSYFLARLSQKQLSKVVFPLGSMTKDETYQLVEAHGFVDFRGKESQDVCFLKNDSVVSFLETRLEERLQDGPVITVDGGEIGRHKGLHRYTIGQRRGLGLPDTTPWYVCSLDFENNTLVVGKNNDLFATTIKTGSAHWLVNDIPKAGDRFKVKIRYSHAGAQAKVQDISPSAFTLTFDTPQRAVAPGQFAVLYRDDRVIGSGEIIS